MRLFGFGRRARPAEPEVAVVGSGLPAAAVALELARRGRHVVVCVAAPADGTVPGLGLVACGPGRPYARVVQALGPEGARTVWMAGRENHGRLRALLQQTRSDCGYRRRGSFLLSRDRLEGASLAESEDMLRDDGFPGEFLDHYMLETRFDVSGFTAAYWAAEDGEVDAGLLLRETTGAARVAGASWRPDPVRAVEIDRSGATVRMGDGPLRAEWAVVASEGPVSGMATDLVGHLQAVPGERRRLGVPPGARLPSAARTADGRFAWQEDAGGITLAAIGVEAAAGPTAAPALDDLVAHLHVIAAGTSRWSEPCEVTVDGLPLIGLWPGRPLAVACGFGLLAASLAFVAAGWVADALAAGVDPTPGPLRAARFLPARA